MCSSACAALLGLRCSTDADTSADTVERARNSDVELLSSDAELVRQCSLILSVVPPRDAEATAQRIIDALSASCDRSEPLYFADLNAVAPSTCKRMAAWMDKSGVPVRFIDGCILGGPPRRKDEAERGAVTAGLSMVDGASWDRPRIPVSGPHSLSTLPDGARLASVLNLRSISPDIGAASGLKMCFAAMSKGFTALATQSYTTAARLGVAEELKREQSLLMPRHFEIAERSVPSMVPKAYRWVREMEEIALTMHEEGGWEKDMFNGVAGVYEAVAHHEILSQEKIGKRRRGTTVQEVAALLSEELERKKKRCQ